MTDVISLAMDDIETIVRSIVAQSDVNVLTKRMVRTEYRKLTGSTSLPGSQKLLINSLLDKIVGELAQEVSPSVQSPKNSNKDRDSKNHAQTTESRVHNTQISESSVDNNFGCSKTTKHNPENFQTLPTKPADVSGCESPQSQHIATAGRTDQKSPNSSGSATPPTRPRLLTAREAMSVVLDSDSDDNNDSGDSDSQDSPLKRTAVKVLNVKQNFKGQNKEVHSKRDSTIYIESSDSTEEFLPAKKCKIQNEDKQEMQPTKRDFVSSDTRKSSLQDGLNKSRSRRLKTQGSAVKHRCNSESSASSGSSELSLMIDVASSPCNSGSETMLATDGKEANSGRETMLATDAKEVSSFSETMIATDAKEANSGSKTMIAKDVMETSIPHHLLCDKGVQQKFINKISRGKGCSREPRGAGSPVDHSTPRKTGSPDKSKRVVNSKLHKNYSSGLPLLRLKINARLEKGMTNSETTTSDSDLNEVLLLESCVSDSDNHAEVGSAALFRKQDPEVRVCADSDSESESVQPPRVDSFHSLIQEGSSGRESDADDSFATCFRAKRIGSNRKGKFIIDSDSDSQMSCRSATNLATKELKKNFKPRFTVMIKNVSESDDNFDVIKNGVISDSEVLESLEDQCSKTNSGKLKEDRTSSSKHSITKKRRSTVNEQNVSDCTKNKKPARKKSVTRGGNLAKSEESSCWKGLSDSSDENDLPLSVVKAQLSEDPDKFNTANSGDIQAKSSLQTPKRSNGQKFQCLVDKENNSPDSCSASFTPSSRNKNGSRCASRVDSSPDDSTSNSPKEKMSPLVIVTKCSVKKTSHLFSRKAGSVSSDSISEDEDERADVQQRVTTTTSGLSSEQNNTDSSTSSMSDSNEDTRTVTTKEPPEKKQQKQIEIAELTRLRKICRTVGLILRNSKELLGCCSDQDKVARIRQLLEERGMKGKPTLKKADQLNLIKEMQELQCKDVTSNSQDKAGTRSGRPKRRVARDIFTLSPVKKNFSSRNFCDTVSELEGIITVDESDSS